MSEKEANMETSFRYLGGSSDGIASDELKPSWRTRLLWRIEDAIPYRVGRQLAKVRSAYWWVMHRIHPCHRYHVVKTQLPPGYHEPDDLIFEASFALLCRYVKHNEWWLKQPDPSHSDGWQHARREIRFLYEWWTVTRKNRPVWQDSFTDEEGQAFVRQEDAFEDEDQAMLVRLIAIRRYLWS